MDEPFDRPLQSRRDVIEAVHEALDQRSHIDAKTHAAHHQYLANMIDDSARRRTLVEKTKQQVIGWGVILALGGIGTAVYHYVVNLVQHGGGR